MSSLLCRSLWRALLIVMLATFASPEFGRGMVSSHDELMHTAAGHGHGHDHDDGDHPDPHANAGHLLAHMSVGCPATPVVIAPVRVHETLHFRQAHAYCAATDPPYKPPRSLLVG